ncbi:type II CAAX prenyl endopeptidase Rce1 family protein [Planctomycetota bacterium]
MSSTSTDGQPSNRDLLLPYLAPYAAYVGVAALCQGRVSHEVDYCARLATAGALLGVFWRRYVSLRGPGSRLTSCLTGVAAGVLGVGLWIGLLAPFVDATDGAPWSGRAFALRLLAAALLVPLFEELFLRGYVLRILVQWGRVRATGVTDPLGVVLFERSISSVQPGAWTATAVLLSSLAFALGHAPVQLPAAFAYGVLMACLWILRRDLLTCVVAHGTTNLVLYTYVYASGSWALF